MATDKGLEKRTSPFDTITLEEWRRARDVAEPVHVVLPTPKHGTTV